MGGRWQLSVFLMNTRATPFIRIKVISLVPKPLVDGWEMGV